MVAVPGSEILSGALHVVSQSLLIPVIAGLLLFMVYAIITLGGLMSEYSGRIRTDIRELESAIKSISNPGTPERIIEVVNSMEIPQSQKEVLTNIAETSELGPKSREALARKLIENEELKAAKSLEKTDIVTRLGPTLGLMGTLIPMGPGLAALGAGDINTLAQAIIIAFDTTVVGLASGGIAYVISKVRRRWYEEYLSNLETMAEAVLEVMDNAAQTPAKAPVGSK
ncbi:MULTISPECIES: MotA/TolQ/ExbB proton channel family protein [Methanothermobacter]|uniref:Predicted transporter protein n=1 Tax=Methanothermobacter marburgensis (strain ATCC BAA-927 / DSM 2133 / JCM 14651 / NBRC 100331 / OCM 82 / Marburg) TaxID=79929 RepID=D9PWP9_METTM|nr:MULTISPECIES: MotA/TolQ/ExbB proton channel family protein [Methanothermobacter]ADL58647.1 predicted transporter protein [Methanothermobacter marburgensis str. Marburg]QEF95130.1 MotA/TolQ/ExbB proton channel family protein [Methanothermobacter sp. KEPCO-1]QHN07521.1 MotA/TolQ/ExbB proton channel family protein [Methanothermobacter sp. THM-2]WBF09227.1 MotA/TolQ/ExbB proton channel family protein [Methanothermobacter marburgensis]